MRRILLVLVAVFLIAGLSAAQEIKLVSSRSSGVTLQWHISAYHIKTVGAYSVVDYPTGGGLYGVGKPNLPSKQVFIEVPRDGQVSLQVYEPVFVVHQLSKPIVPAQEPPVDTIGAEQKLGVRFMQDAAAYASSKPYPGKIVEIAYQGIMRGRKLLLVRFNPFQYIAKTGQLRVYQSFTVNIQAQSNSLKLAQSDQAMDPVAKGLVLNYVPGKASAKGVDFLILTVADMAAAANDYAAFKNQQGYTTAVEVLDNQPSVSTVKDKIRAYYPGVAYVMILADHGQIALPSSGARHPLGDARCRLLGLEDSSIPSDNYYACVDGSDYYPDVYLGRVPANNMAEATLLLNKLKYYQTNDPEHYEWCDRFLLCGEFQYQYSNKNTAERLFCETAFTIYNSLHTRYTFPTQTIGSGSYGLGHSEYYFRTPADPNNPEKPGTYRDKINDDNPPVVNCRMPNEWAANIVADSTAKANTLDYWNAGCFWVQHRDHGSNTGWGKPSLSKSDVANLTNGKRMPILFSINCLTGSMDYSSDCFVEAALKNPNGGAAAAIGSTRVSYSWWNDRLCDGFYTCVWGTEGYDCLDTGINIPTTHPFSRKLGVILNFGKMYLALNYPSNPWGTSHDYTETEFYLFHCIGDPSLEVWISNPSAK